MNEAILMSASADNIDFMIHGLFSFQLFGQEVWITTSHVCIAIVMLVLVIFSIVGRRTDGTEHRCADFIGGDRTGSQYYRVRALCNRIQFYEKDRGSRQ